MRVRPSGFCWMGRAHTQHRDGLPSPSLIARARHAGDGEQEAQPRIAAAGLLALSHPRGEAAPAHDAGEAS